MKIEHRRMCNNLNSQQNMTAVHIFAVELLWCYGMKSDGLLFAKNKLNGISACHLIELN